MSAPRPFVRDPFHPPISITNIKQFLYISESVPVMFSMWYLEWLSFYICACGYCRNIHIHLVRFEKKKGMLISLISNLFLVLLFKTHLGYL